MLKLLFDVLLKLLIAVVVQVVEYFRGKEKVVGSSPIFSSIYVLSLRSRNPIISYGEQSICNYINLFKPVGVAEWLRHWTANPATWVRIPPPTL